MAAAESCTGGLVLKLLTDVPGSSAYVEGGVVAYSDQVKVEVLGVPRELIREHGAVSGEVAEAMARGVRNRLGVEVGVAVTGIAGPGGAVAGKPVGTVWFAVADPEEVRVEAARFPGSRREIRARAADHALSIVLRAARG